MRTITFNSVEEEIGASYGCEEDIKKGRVRTPSPPQLFRVIVADFQIRNLIDNIREYGVGEDMLFSESDLLYMQNIPKVARCLKEVATIVSYLIKRRY